MRHGTVSDMDLEGNGGHISYIDVNCGGSMDKAESKGRTWGKNWKRSAKDKMESRM